MVHSGAYYTSVPSSNSQGVSTVSSTSYTTAASSGVLSRPPAASSMVTSTSNLPSSQVPTASQAAERSRSGSQSHSGGRPSYIIRPKIIGIPYERESEVPAHTFLSTTISLLLYMAVMIIIFSVKCPFDRDVAYFFAFVLLAFTGSLFTLIINLRAVRHHKYDCVGTTLSLLYSGSAVLVVFGLVHTGIYGLCKPNGVTQGSVFFSGVSANYFMWVMTSLSVLWQFIAHYYYG